MLDSMKIAGRIEITLFDPTGEVKDFRSIDNLIVTEGFDHYLDSMFGAQSAQGTFLGIGTTASSLNESDSALEDEVLRQAGTYSHTNNTKQGTVATTFGAGTLTGAIVEMGLWDVVSGGTLICRGTFAAVNKGTLDSLECKYIHSLA